MALINIANGDNDPWMIEHESCEKLYREIEGLLNVRDLEHKSSEKYILYSSQIRLRLKQYADEVQQLLHKLRGLSTSMAITMDEEERRERMIELLQSRNILLNRRFQNRNNSNMLERQELMRPSTSKVAAKKVETPITGWLDSDDDEKPLLNENALKQQQQYLLKEQDDGLDELASIVSRQKNIAITISSEVDMQNEMVDDLLVKMDKTTAGIENETKNVGQILKKDSTRGLWVIIILLLIANIFVALS